MKTTSERKNMYEVINNMIMEKIQTGKMPWKQTWSNFGPARNYVSKKPYSGINALILNNTEYEYPLFLTFLQVKELGGYIKKGSKSIEVIYWKTLEFENDEKIKRILEENRKKNATGSGKKSKFMTKLQEAMKASEEAKRKTEDDKKKKKR